MSIPVYTLGYPPDGSSLGQTKQTIRNNLDGTFLTLAVDHINNNGQPGSNPAGYHKVIHMVSQAGDPPLVAAVGQLYTKSVNSGGNTDTSLFFETGGGGGRKLQLTSNFTPTISANGYTFLAGVSGTSSPIIQWGSTTAVTNSGSTIVTFPKAFPNAVFSVQVTAVTSDNTTIRLSLEGNATKTGFTTTQTSSTKFTNMYWMAIGN